MSNTYLFLLVTWDWLSSQLSVITLSRMRLPWLLSLTVTKSHESVVKPCQRLGKDQSSCWWQLANCHRGRIQWADSKSIIPQGLPVPLMHFPPLVIKNWTSPPAKYSPTDNFQYDIQCDPILFSVQRDESYNDTWYCFFKIHAHGQGIDNVLDRSLI